MKLLWFANTPCGASEILAPNLVVGGWLSSLEKAIVKHKGIELHICFFWNETISPFKHNGTWYYPIQKIYKKSNLRRFIEKRYFQITDDEYIARNLKQIVADVNPDLIHVHGTEENFGLVIPMVSVPSILSVQGILMPISEKYFSGIPQSIITKFETWKSKYSLHSELFSFNDMLARAKRERIIYSEAKYIIGRTDWDRRIASLLSPKAKYIVGNEMLRDSFYSHKWSTKHTNNTLRIVTINSGGIYKGFETIFSTANILELFGEFSFEWIVIGQSEDDNLVRIAKKWKRYNSKSITFVGRKTEQQIIDIMLNSDVYCQVSHIENSPNSVCEAMLLGMPIIATFAGGTSSILLDKSEGLLVQDGDPYAMAGALKELHENYRSALEFGSNAYIKAHKRHNKETITLNLLETYIKISTSNINYASNK